MGVKTFTLQFHSVLSTQTSLFRWLLLGGGKFKYDTRKQFEYDYSVEVVSLFNGTSRNESRMYVEGFATLNFYTECDGLLTLRDLKLSEKPIGDMDTQTHPKSELLSESITEYSLRFAFNDGIISEVCPNEEEKSWVLNFKKGLLSMLHNSMKRFDLDHYTEEEDIRGICKTWYNVKGANGTSLIIEKNKDLNSCRGRAKLHSFVQSTPYAFRPVSWKVTKFTFKHLEKLSILF